MVHVKSHLRKVRGQSKKVRVKAYSRKKSAGGRRRRSSQKKSYRKRSRH